MSGGSATVPSKPAAPLIDSVNFLRAAFVLLVGNR